MPRGMRGLRACAGKDLVWGTVPHAKPDFTAYGKCYDGLARVHTKVTPFAADAQGVLRGEVPEQWFEGEEIQLPWTINTRGAELEIPEDVDGPTFCSGAHVAYEDGKQRWVNLFYWSAISENGNFKLRWWHQYDIQEKSTSSWVFKTHDPELSQGFDNDHDNYPLKFQWPTTETDAFDGNNHSEDTFADDVMSICFGPSGYSRRAIRPDSWSAGKRYLVFSSYRNTDGIEGVPITLARFDNFGAAPDNADDHWAFVASNLTVGANEFRLVRPSLRQYLELSGGASEPWMCAYNDATNQWATGPWTNSDNKLTSPAHVYTAPPLLGPRANCICYKRMQGRDLFIFRHAKEGVEAERSSTYFIFDGEQFVHLTGDYAGDKPSCITLDETGNLYYGNRRFVRRLGVDGWYRSGDAHFMSSGDAISAPEFQPAIDADDPEQNVENTEYTVAAASQFEEHFFQILPNGNSLHVKVFFGDASYSTLPIEHVEWSDWQLADETNSREGQRRASEVLFCWTVSRDGTVWNAHVQDHFPYQGGSDTTTHRIHARAYVSRNPSEWDPAGQYGDAGIYWPKYRSSNVPHDLVVGMQWFRPWIDRFGGEYPSEAPLTITYDKFISEAVNFDFDPVVCCCAGCGELIAH